MHPRRFSQNQIIPIQFRRHTTANWGPGYFTLYQICSRLPTVKRACKPPVGLNTQIVLSSPVVVVSREGRPDRRLCSRKEDTRAECNCTSGFDVQRCIDNHNHSVHALCFSRNAHRLPSCVRELHPSLPAVTVQMCCFED